jgi:hypothetical protein
VTNRRTPALLILTLACLVAVPALASQRPTCAQLFARLSPELSGRELAYESWAKESRYFQLEGKDILAAADDGGSDQLAQNEALQLAFRSMVRVEHEYLHRKILSRERLAEFTIQELLGDVARQSEDFVILSVTGPNKIPLPEILDREYAPLFDPAQWKELRPYVVSPLPARRRQARPAFVEYDEIRAASALFIRPKVIPLGNGQMLDVPETLRGQIALWSRHFIEKSWGKELRGPFMMRVLDLLESRGVRQIVAEFTDAGHVKLAESLGFKTWAPPRATAYTAGSDAGMSRFMMATIEDVRAAIARSSK